MTRRAEPFWLWNGRLLPESAVHIHPRDRGLCYGDGAYETLRIHRGHPLLLEAHHQRLQRGLGVLGIPIDPTAAFPAGALQELVAANVGTGEGRLRLVVTRGRDDTMGPTLLASVDPLPEATPLSDPGPVRLAVVETFSPRPEGWSSLKSLSYLSYVLASSEARRQGADEALLVMGPTVLETTSANVFAVVDGELWTPPASAGILLGVTRDVVVTLARERAIAVHEERVDVKDLGRADEIFLTGSVRGLRAVSTVDHTAITDPIPGPVTHTLRAAYAERLETVSSEPETT